MEFSQVGVDLGLPDLTRVYHGPNPRMIDIDDSQRILLRQIHSMRDVLNRSIRIVFEHMYVASYPAVIDPCHVGEEPKPARSVGVADDAGRRSRNVGNVAIMMYIAVDDSAGETTRPIHGVNAGTHDVRTDKICAEDM